MTTFRTAILAAALMLPVCAAAQAEDFKVTTIGSGADFVGCLAQNEKAGLGFLAVGGSVALFAQSSAFKIAKGDPVAGTWAVDGGAPAAFSSKSDATQTATIDVPNTAEAVVALTTGERLTVVASGATATFDLAGAADAFTGLASCMTTKSAP